MRPLLDDTAVSEAEAFACFFTIFKQRRLSLIRFIPNPCFRVSYGTVSSGIIPRFPVLNRKRGLKYFHVLFFVFFLIQKFSGYFFFFFFGERNTTGRSLRVALLRFSQSLPRSGLLGWSLGAFSSSTGVVFEFVLAFVRHLGQCLFECQVQNGGKQISVCLALAFSP